jgi:hypothetical protein
MAIKVNGFDGNPFDLNSIDSNFRFFTAYYQLTPSGSYVTGGDTVDFTNGGINSAAPPSSVIICADVFSNGVAAGLGAAGGYYTLVPPAGGVPSTALTTWKLQAWAAGGTQVAAGAYPSTVTGDTIIAKVTWKKAF